MFIKKLIYLILFISCKFIYSQEYLNKNILEYHANIQDNDFNKKKSYLIGDAFLIYNNNIFIKAEYIEINWEKNIIYAISKIDISKNNKESVIFKKDKIYECDNLIFNIKKNTLSFNNIINNELEGSYIAKYIEKNKELLSINDIFYTTDIYFKKNKNIIPDYYLKTDFIKKIQNKFYITGPLSVFLYQVPIPLFLPFLFVPIYQNDISPGFLTPRLLKKNSNEFFFENLGFFFPISKNLYTKTALSFHKKKGLMLDHKIKYDFNNLYSGFFSIKFKNKYYDNYQFIWNHNQKTTNKSIIFSSKINYINNKNFYKNISNNTFSYFTLVKNFKLLPLRLFLGSFFKQNFINDTINIRTPNIKLDIKKLNLFKKLNIKYKINYYSNIDINKKKFLRSKNILKHKILINTNFNIFKNIKIYPIINYNEYYSFSKNKNINDLYTYKKFNILIDSYLKKDFLNFKIRYLYSPLLFFKKYYNNINNINNINIKNLSFNKISFTLSNIPKTNISFFKNFLKINNFIINTTYNIKNNIFKWQNINFNGKGFIYKNILFDINAVINPYKIDFKSKIDKNTIHISNNFFSLKSILFFLSYDLKSKNFFNKKKNFLFKKNIQYEKFFFDKKDYAINPKDWNINISLVYNYNKYLLLNNYFVTNKFFLKFFGEVYPTPYWLINFNIDYDIFNKKINSSIIKISRDLRSFKTSLTFSTLLNNNDSWSFFIGLKYPIIGGIKLSNFEINEN